VGAPEPLVFQSDNRTLFAFYAKEFDETGPEVITAEFVECVTLRYGFPNDEALHGHPPVGQGSRVLPRT
jgi:hypothetical protein